MITDQQIIYGRDKGLISPSLAHAALRTWHTGTGAARKAARYECELRLGTK